jgi:hypothetical protein
LPRKFLINANTRLLDQPNPRALDNVNTVAEYGAAMSALDTLEIRVQYYALLREQAGRSAETLATRRTHPARVVRRARREISVPRCPPRCCAWRSTPSSASGHTRSKAATRWCSFPRWPADERAFTFRRAPLDPAALQRRAAATNACGGFAAFEGWVRNHNEGHAVTRLEYEAFAELAEKEGARIVQAAIEKFGVTRAACVHRIGSWPSATSRSGSASAPCIATRRSAPAATSSMKSNTACRSGRRSITSTATRLGQLRAMRRAASTRARARHGASPSPRARPDRTRA